jgi:DisA bacterial checkpoint controller nucleotide-binding
MPPSAWKVNSPKLNVRFTEFSKVRRIYVWRAEEPPETRPPDARSCTHRSIFARRRRCCARSKLAQLDGAFVVSDEVAVVSAARYTVVASEDLDLPLGLGSRHMAGSSISLRTDGVAVVILS